MPTYNVPNTAKQTCASGTTRTVLQVAAPATRNLVVTAFSVGGFSIDPNAQTGEVRLIITDAAGTSGTTITPVPTDLRETAALHSAKEVFTVEPGTNPKVVSGPFPLSPVSTLFAWQFPPEEYIVVPANKFLNIVCLFPGASQDVYSSLTVRE